MTSERNKLKQIPNAPLSNSASSAKSKVWLGELLELRLAGAQLADGVDPDEHIGQLREGCD